MTWIEDDAVRAHQKLNDILVRMSDELREDLRETKGFSPAGHIRAYGISVEEETTGE